jgi:hypothetical protein
LKQNIQMSVVLKKEKEKERERERERDGREKLKD